MLKKIKENKIKWKDIPCSWTRRIDIIKLPLLTKLYNPNQNDSYIFAERGKCGSPNNHNHF
jgi:hypothetical protein